MSELLNGVEGEYGDGEGDGGAVVDAAAQLELRRLRREEGAGVGGVVVEVARVASAEGGVVEEGMGRACHRIFRLPTINS